MGEKAMITETPIADCFVFSSPIHHDSRGTFREWYVSEPLFSVAIKQGNVSISGKGVLRGLHFSIGNDSQAKVVTCVGGEIQDVLVDVRPESPSFRKVFSINLSPTSGQSLLVASGVAHGFLSLKEGSAVVYLTSEKYNPVAERSLNAADPLLEGVWYAGGFTRSPRDQKAPFFEDLTFDW
jgi:dTDP-4-dehydrorhamnose 3,5-epimerase